MLLLNASGLALNFWRLILTFERRVKTCSICGKPRVPAYRAFCSAACRDRDLLAWGSDTYVMPEDPDLKVDDLISEDEGEKALDS